MICAYEEGLGYSFPYQKKKEGLGDTLLLNRVVHTLLLIRHSEKKEIVILLLLSSGASASALAIKLYVLKILIKSECSLFILYLRFSRVVNDIIMCCYNKIKFSTLLHGRGVRVISEPRSYLTTIRWDLQVSCQFIQLLHFLNRPLIF